MIEQGYKEYVESQALNARNGGEGMTFFNSGPIHASIVMSRIFKYSDKTVKIFCGGFSGAVSNDKEYLDQIDSFVTRGGKLQILVQNFNREKLPKVIKRLKENPLKKNVELKSTKALIRKVKGKEEIHFTVGDDRMVRVETNTKDFKAQVNFNSKEEASALTGIFDELFNTTDINVVTPITL